MNLEESRQILLEFGYSSVSHIASGMEGHVFSVGNDQVAKVWFSKGEAELRQLQRFYEVVDSLNLPFATPLLTKIRVRNGATISVERFLSGTPMRDLIRGDEPEPPEFATNAVISVLAALKNNPVATEISDLPILGVAPSIRSRNSGYAQVLLEVANSKVDQYGDQLRRSVPDFDVIHAQIAHRVSTRKSSPFHAIHGDICPANILLGPDMKVSALIDWGFLSYFGDQLLEASIACGTYNMYGASYRINDDYLVEKCERRLGFDRADLLIYRALYAILTSNAYSEDGTDGHYEWCVGMLNRDDIRDAIAMSDS